MNRTGKIISYRDIFGAGYPQLYLVLAGSVAVTAGNVYLRWSIGEALDGGGLSPWLLAVAAGLLAVTQLQSCHRQILSAKVQRDIYHRLQAKVLHSTMAGLERSNMGAITTYYITDVGQVDSFTARILYKAFPDLAGWLATVGLPPSICWTSPLRGWMNGIQS